MSDASVIYIEDGTGRQIARPEDSRTGGSTILKGNDVSRWREANPDKVLTKEAAKTEDKAVAGPQKKTPTRKD